MQLNSLAESLDSGFETAGHLQDMDIVGVTTDPNLCRPGFLYVAAESETVDSTRLGVRLDGRDYIDLAIKNGAAAVLTTPGVSIVENDSSRVALLLHEAPLSLLGLAAAKLYGARRPEVVALVTGTNGKTSVVNFASRLWAAAGHPSCSVGNLGGVCSDGTLVWDRDPTLSVPETVFLHKMLRDLAIKGVNHVALEATSHALFDYRLHGVDAKIGAFTNLTRDHLDFHGTLDEYFRVKMKLFNEVLAPGSYAVLNADAEWFAPAQRQCQSRRHNILTYGYAGGEIRLVSATSTKIGQHLKLAVLGRSYESDIQLRGPFQASNVLCSLAIAIASGIEPESAVGLLSSLTEVEGRLNTVAMTPAGGQVIVDYAHTPDGIKAALEACRSFTMGKVFIVFGANGDRDPGKRKDMGAMAAAFADEIIVTDGHPRHEDAAAIRRAVMEGAPQATEIGDREQAIHYAIERLKDGDTLLIAGMGHEKFQVVGDQRIPFCDRDVAARCVGRLAEAEIRR